MSGIDPHRFTWKDGERTIHFGRGALDDAAAILGTGYTLLSTERARAMAPQLAAGAAATHDVAPGRVDELAGALLDVVDPAELIVALGGGRIVDVAKALAAARPPGERPRVAAVPTTLSAAEMTAIHRRAAGADGSLPGVRPAIVINDPALSASQPDAALAASAANALGHAAEGPATTRASPVPALAGREAARLIGSAYAGDGEPDRDELALGALLSGYAIDGCGYGLHHVLSQTLARFGGVGHGQANAAMLPHTLPALGAPRGSRDRRAHRARDASRTARRRLSPARSRRRRSGPRRLRGRRIRPRGARSHPAPTGPRRAPRPLRVGVADLPHSIDG